MEKSQNLIIAYLLLAFSISGSLYYIRWFNSYKDSPEERAKRIPFMLGLIAGAGVTGLMIYYIYLKFTM